jgi:integrase
MSREEYQALPRAADSFQHEIAIPLTGDYGLGVGEVLDVEPRHISRMTDGRHYELDVVGGKDTAGEFVDGKQRETWFPVDVEATIDRYVQTGEIARDDPLVDVTKRTVQNRVERAAVGAAEENGDSDYQRVSTHDLRPCWANHLPVEEHVSPRIVMALGGWNSYDATEPFLAAPTEENIIDPMSGVAL